ncbi:unnamed protein product [Effrenium voratum]|nr:unnamed protein product [Effrenium voratum]
MLQQKMGPQNRKNAKNMWASLRLFVYLQMSVRGCGFLHVPGKQLTGQEAEDSNYLSGLASCINQSACVKTYLKELRRRMQVVLEELEGHFPSRKRRAPNLTLPMTELLAGFSADTYLEAECSKVPLVTLESGCLSAHFRFLMSTVEDGYSSSADRIYNQGRDAVAAALQDLAIQFQDVVAGRVLERLYFWSLGCFLSQKGRMGKLHPHLKDMKLAEISALAKGRLLRGLLLRSTRRLAMMSVFFTQPTSGRLPKQAVICGAGQTDCC